MELSQLKYFKALAETEHLAHTAEKLFISGPALSATITRLERELGTTLFDHVGRNIQLNERGSVYLYHIDQILSSLENANHEVSEMEKSRRPTLSVVVTSPLIWQNLLCAFMDKFPNIVLSHISVNLSKFQISDLSTQYDYLITAPTDLNNENLHSIVLFSDDRPMLVVNLAHRFASLDKIQLSEAANEPFIAIQKGYSSRKYFDELFAIASIKPKIVLECDYLMRGEMVKAGRGIALATANSRKCSPISNVQYIEIVNPQYRRSQALFWHARRYQTKSALLFREFAVEYFKDGFAKS
ncbi:MAG: LysR family transcriptional regulator [Negativicutes bacterium]